MLTSQEEFEDIKWVIRIRISKKNRQHNGQKENVQKDKQRSTKHTYKTKHRHDPVTQTPLKHVGELKCSGRVSSSFSTSDTRRVNLVTNNDTGTCIKYEIFYILIPLREECVSFGPPIGE